MCLYDESSNKFKDSSTKVCQIVYCTLHLLYSLNSFVSNQFPTTIFGNSVESTSHCCCSLNGPPPFAVVTHNLSEHAAPLGRGQRGQVPLQFVRDSFGWVLGLRCSIVLPPFTEPTTALQDMKY